MARYLSLAAQARPILAARLTDFVAAAAVTVRDEIVAVIEEGDPSGRFYFVPETRERYRASAPDEPPAVREGVYVSAWQFTPAVEIDGRIVAGVYNDRFVGATENIPLWRIFEEGATPQLSLFEAVGGGMAPRPHIAEGVERAVPIIERLAQQAAA